MKLMSSLNVIKAHRRQSHWGLPPAAMLVIFGLLLVGGTVHAKGHKLIYDSTTVFVEESGLSKVHVHQRFRVTSMEGGKELSSLFLDYDPLSAWVEFRDARIHRIGGDTEIISLEKVLDYPAPARAIYWGSRKKMLPVGRLMPGDELEVRWFRKGFTYALLEGDDDERYIPPMRGHFYDIVPFYSDIDIDLKYYEVYLPRTKTLQFSFFHGQAQTQTAIKGEMNWYAFSMSDITPLKREAQMVDLSDVAPKLLLTTSPDWEAKSMWFYGVNEDFGSFEWDDAILRKTNEILDGALNEIDSISRLTHWVADEIRYSGISMGEGEGYTLHKATMTFTDRAGVCKDKAGMLVAMLRAAGFESYAAMTMAGSRIEDIPADQFNHSVTVVKMKDGSYMLLDPTWVPFVRELWSSAEQQQQYLKGLPEGADLMTTPVSPPDLHYVRMDGFSEIKEDGTLHGGFTISGEGQSDANIRRMFTSNAYQTWKPQLEQVLRDVHPRAVITGMEMPDPYDYSDPIMIRIQYIIPQYATVSDKEIIFVPFTAAGLFERAMPHLGFNIKLKERKYPFRDRCSRLVELFEVIKVPAYKEVRHLPPPANVSGSGAYAEGLYTAYPGEVRMFQRLLFYKRLYEPLDWPSFREAVEWQKRYQNEPIILAR